MIEGLGRYLELIKYLERFMIHSNWCDKHVPERARSIFTTICLGGNLSADGRKGELMHLYNISALEELDVEYEDFESFMLELIV